MGVGAWVKMTDIAHPVITMANSTSETWYQQANDASDDHVVLYSYEIHAALAEISHMSHLGRIRTFRCDAKEAF